MTRSVILSETPFLRVWRSVTGSVAADEQHPQPVKYAGNMFHSALNGLRPATMPATAYWMSSTAEVTQSAVTIIVTHPLPTATNFPLAVMSAIKRRESVLISDPGPSATTGAKNLFCRTWTAANGERWLLLSNANRERISATVRLGETFAAARAEDGIVAALSEPNALSVNLEPLESGFVKLD